MENYLIYGAMGLGGDWSSETPLTKIDITQGINVIKHAIDLGITYFDFADIYRSGKSERVMGEFLKKHPQIREKLTIQSKVGIRLDHIPTGTTYDFSYDYIIESVNQILDRLNTSYLDCLLLHRPDPLMDKEELCRAIAYLFDQGKIKNLGVSNMNQHHIQLIESYTGRKVIINQLELSLKKSEFVDSHIGFNNNWSDNSSFPMGLIEYCILNDISLQAWSPMSQGLFTGNLPENPSKAIIETSALVEELAVYYKVSKEAIVLGWLMRHPAKINPVIGTTNLDRLKKCTQALDFEMSREHWYELYTKSKG